MLCDAILNVSLSNMLQFAKEERKRQRERFLCQHLYLEKNL